MTKADQYVSSSGAPPRGRLIAGGSVFIVGQLAPLLIPLVARTELSTGLKTAISGILLLGIPELGILIGAVILGKAGYVYVKEQILRFLRRHVIPAEVGRARYRVGLVLFILPLLWGWAGPYMIDVFPSTEQHRFWFAVAGDTVLLFSLFVLGGDFWEKLRTLFVHRSDG